MHPKKLEIEIMAHRDLKCCSTHNLVDYLCMVLVVELFSKRVFENELSHTHIWSSYLGINILDLF